MTINKSELSKRLFSEKSVWDLLKNYETAHVIPFTAKWLSFTAICLSAVFAFAYFVEGTKLSELHGLAGTMTSFAMGLAGALFGVAIAGFAIFASTINAEVLLKLAATNYKKSKVNNLSYIFSMFIYVLVTLFFIFITSFCYEMLIGPNSAFIGLNHSFQIQTPYANAIVLLYSTLLVGQITFVFSILFSFIWNLYQVLMVISGAKIIAELDKLESDAAANHNASPQK